MAGKASKGQKGEVAPLVKTLAVAIVHDLIATQKRLGPDPKLAFQGHQHADAAQAAGFSMGPDTVRLASDLLVALGPESPFEDVGELVSFVFHRFDSDPDSPLRSELSPESEERFWATVAHSVANPLRGFRFSVPLVYAAPYAIEGMVRSSDELALSAEDADGSFTLMLRGTVNACTSAGATTAVERLVDTVLGALQALDLAGGILQRTVAPRGVSIQFEDESVPMHPACAHRVGSTFAKLPDALSELERLQWERGDYDGALARAFRVLRGTLSLKEGRAEKVRNACRLAHVAIHSTDFGLLVALAFTVMEGLLLDPNSTDSVTAKLSEAVAHSLGKSEEDRASYRKQVKRLYELRSMFTHTGVIRGRQQAREEVLVLMLRVLLRSMEELSDSQSPEPHEPGT